MTEMKPAISAQKGRLKIIIIESEGKDKTQKD